MAGMNEMEVSAETLSAIVSRVDHVIEDKTIDGIVELEGVITKRVDVVEFMRVISYCMSSGLPMVQHDPCLDITFSNVTLPKGHAPLVGVRVSVSGFEHISRYYALGALEKLPMNSIRVIRKTRVRGFPQLDVANYDIRFNLRAEESCAMSTFEPKTLRAVPKTFRLKSRISFMSKDGMFRYDFTKVHMSDGTSQHISNSGVTQSKERYEIEVELLQPSVLQSAKSLLKRVKSTPSETIAKSLLSHMGLLLSVMSDSPAITSKAETQSVIKDYEKLTGSTRFGGSQPVTLERKHMLPVELLPPNSKSIQSGYSVTLKYDGDRHLMFVSPPEGKVYLISRSRFITNVKSLGFAAPTLVGTLLDGEFMPDDRAFAAFDLYYDNGRENTGSLEERLSRLGSIIEELRKNSSSIDIVSKQFKIGDGQNMFVACKELLDSVEYGDVPYGTDGLIFTPVGSFEDKIFKWKPPEMNTIDFLVTYKMHTATKTVLQLFCGYRHTKHASVSPKDYIDDGGAAAKAALSESRYIARKFQNHGITEIQHAANDRLPRCENGDVIDDKSIVECRFDPDNSKWIPIKVRWDKVQEMYNSKRITANNCDTANSVWRTITIPVSVEALKGEVHIDENYVDVDSDLYYNRGEIEDLSSSENMRRFHNWVIKLCVLLGWSVHDLESKDVSVLDVGCGKGGDIPKYLLLGVRRVLGIDMSVNNIRDPTDGAYARLEELTKSHKKSDVDYVFLSMDASKPFADPEDALSASMTEEDRDAVQVLWGIREGPNERWNGFAKSPFDIVSLMFDVHYMFDSQKSIDTLIESISNMVRPGSLVVGACLDGRLVHEAFRETTTIGGKGSNGQIVYQLEKKYTDDHFDETPYGNMIGVYVESINRLIDEPLVKLDVLQERFEKFGFETVRVDNFRNVYVAALEDIGQFVQLVPDISKEKTKRTLEAVQNMSPEERNYSFLHAYFIFRKK